MGFRVLPMWAACCISAAALSAWGEPVTLVTDDFTTGLDGRLYALERPANAVTANNGLEMAGTPQKEICELASVEGAFPDNITVEAQARVSSFERVNSQINEANFGFRIHETVSGGIGCEVFTYSNGRAGHKLVVRKTNPFEKGAETKLSRQLVPDELVTIIESVNGPEVRAAVYDEQGHELGKLSTKLPEGVKNTGGLRLTQFNHRQAQFHSIRVMDNETRRSILLDSFCGSWIDSALWYGPARDLVTKVLVTNGQAVFDAQGDKPAILPLRAKFRDFDLLAAFRLEGVAPPSGNITVSFRSAANEDAGYEFVIVPAPGAQLNGFPSPCMALRRRFGPGSFRYLSGPFTFQVSELHGNFVVSVIAAGDRLTASLGQSREKLIRPGCSVTDNSLKEGQIAFSATSVPGLKMDKYSIQLPVTDIGSSPMIDADIH